MIGMAVVGISLLCVSSRRIHRDFHGPGTADAQGLHLWMGFADLGMVSGS